MAGGHAIGNRQNAAGSPEKAWPPSPKQNPAAAKSEEGSRPTCKHALAAAFPSLGHRLDPIAPTAGSCVYLSQRRLLSGGRDKTRTDKPADRLSRRRPA